MVDAFKFRNREHQQRLTDRLRQEEIPFEMLGDGSVYYRWSRDARVKKSVKDIICKIRSTIFAQWQLLTFPQNWREEPLKTYRKYMEQRRIPHYFEFANGEITILLPKAYRPHQWKLPLPPNMPPISGSAVI